jgi:hypothetical protein
LGAACCAGARCQEAVVAHPSPLGGGLGDGVSDFLVFDMVYRVLNAGRAGSTAKCLQQGRHRRERRHRLDRIPRTGQKGTAMHGETGLRQAEHAVTPTIQSVAVRREREQSRKEHRRHCGPGGCGMLPASKPSIPWQTGSVSALPEDSVRSRMARAGAGRVNAI